MALPKSGKCCMLVRVILILGTGLLYSGSAFRIRDAIPASSDVCHLSTERCTSTSATISPDSTPASSSWSTVTSLRAKRGFETVSMRGSFAKSKPRPPDEAHKGQNYQALKKNYKISPQRPWSKLSKITNNNVNNNNDSDESKNVSDNDEEDKKRIDSDDEIIQIEVEDEDEVITKNLVYQKNLKAQLGQQRKEREKTEEEEERINLSYQEESKEKKEDSNESQEKQETMRIDEKMQDIKMKELENEKNRKEEEEERLRKQEEQKLQHARDEEERKKREKEEQLIQEEFIRKVKEEEERLIQQEIARKIKEEEERVKKEAETKRKEEERRLKQEAVNRQQEEQRRRKGAAENRWKEQEKQRLQEEEKRRLQEEEKKRLKEKEIQLLKKKEEQRLKEEKCKLKEEERLKNEKKQILESKEIKIKNNEQSTIKLQNKYENIITVNSKEEKSSEYIADAKVNFESTESTIKLKISNDNSATVHDNLKIVGIEKSTSEETKATKLSPEGFLSLAQFNDMLLSVPTFVPNFTAVEDLECQKHGKIFLRQLRGYKLWALQMLDASAKIPPGLLRGNVNQLGDFDQCLGVLTHVKLDERAIKVQGKYCLANMDVYATHLNTRLPVHLMHSRGLIRGTMHDPGYFIPKFTTINWGICLPDVCSAKDARRSIEDALKIYNMTIGIKIMVDVKSSMCYVKQNSLSYSKETIGVLYFYAIFICLTMVATVRDYFVTTQEKGNFSERIIMSFSLKRTIKSLFRSREIDSSKIDCIYGLRSLSMMSLYILHKLIPLSKIPYVNRVTLTEVASNPLSSLLRASLFYTDCLLLLNGVITAYSMIKELTSRDEIRWCCRFIVKYIRLTPSLLAIIFWYAFVMEHTGSGPQWNAIVKPNADLCKQNAWINLLYVQNFFPFEEMCATHTYQLALDMQLSLIAPVIVFFLQVKPIIGFIIVFFIIQVSATLRYFATSSNNLSLIIFHGMTVRQLNKSANMTYLLPLHRATPYVFGVSLGVLLHYTGKNVRIHKIFIILGWLIALALGSWSLLSPWRLARRDYVYNIEEATQYAVLSPISTAVALSWTIFACFTENGGIINRILSSHWMMVFSKLSYTIYLSQFIIFFYNVGTTRYSSEFHLYNIIDLLEVVSVASVSIVLTLLFDIPMQEVKNIIVESTDTPSVEAEKSKKSTVPEENHKDVQTFSEDIDFDDEEEPPPGGWNWNQGTFTKITNSEPRDYMENEVNAPYNNSRMNRPSLRRSMVRSEAYDEWDRRMDSMDRRISRSEEHSIDSGRMNRVDYKMNSRLDDDLPPDNYLYNPRERYYSSGYRRSPMRDTSPFYRSSSREKSKPKDLEVLARDYSNKPIITISKEEDYKNSSRSSRPSMSRFFDQQFSLSESEIDGVGGRRNSNNYNRRSSAELRTSDDDDWESDLHYRRNRYQQERVHSQESERVPPPVVEEEVNDEWNSLKRRSSAEGKMALLKEPVRPGNMELWTVSKMQFGSSQESDDELDDDLYHQRREFREQEPPLPEEFEEDEGNDEDELRKYHALERRAMSFDDGDDISNSFAMNKISKRITVQDLSRIASDDEILKDSGWTNLDVKSNSSGLFKRESIIKSQASEEDPEYLIPERPKLVEQEQEHPFKKAWQEQKSRSEEDGTVTFVIKDCKTSSPILEKRNNEFEYNEEGQSSNVDQEVEIPVPEVTCDVTIIKRSSNGEIHCSESSDNLEMSSILLEPQESSEVEPEVQISVTESEQELINAERQDDLERDLL